MKKVKVTKVKNPISVKPMPSTRDTDPPPPYEGKVSFAGPGLGMSKSAGKSYKK